MYRDQRIAKEAKIWDLHIHTPKCTKVSKEYAGMEISEYVRIFKQTLEGKNVGLISFTDHNIIASDVYEEYMNDEFIPFIVGVEIDVIFENQEKYKHLLVYFDIDADNFEQKKDVIADVNKFLENGPVKIQELLDKLLDINTDFVLSPHAFKQGERAINYEWTDEEKALRAKKYMDQFFNFWEASGHSEIAKGIQFLNDFLYDERISIISFSDSNNFKKLEDYISNPTNLFYSLPNFKGLQMVGTEMSRIVKSDEAKLKNLGNLIGKVSFNGFEIGFSNKLNAIIGGRGSGKSLLLDSIALKLKSTSANTINKERKEFISKNDIHIFNYSNEEIASDNFNFDYFGQAHVSKIFSSPNYNEEIEEYFKEAIDKVESIDKDDIIQDYKTKFSDLLDSNIKNEMNKELGNISDLIEKYCIIKDATLNLGLLKSDKHNEEVLTYPDVEKLRGRISSHIDQKVRDDERIRIKINNLIKEVCLVIKDYNIKTNDKLIFDLLFDEHSEYNSGKSEAVKNKTSIEELFTQTFTKESAEVVKRVNIINAILALETQFENYYTKRTEFAGNEKDAFRIWRIVSLERPVNFFIRKMRDYFGKSSVPDLISGAELKKCIDIYCFDNDKDLLVNKTRKNLDDELIAFEFENNMYCKIEYLENGEYSDIKTLSPGTQTNILMEYLVCKDTTKPLLIDQPEDNVDNLTIYEKIRQWFIDLKAKRQVIVVTHDANIVINADSENLIIAEKVSDSKFKYQYGALEYQDNLVKASIILDGGKTAIKRRMSKYGD